MICPTEYPQRLWGQPVHQGQRGVWKHLGDGVPMCSHCQAGMGEPCAQQAFGIGGIVAAHRHWLLVSGWSPLSSMQSEAAMG